MRLLSHAVAFVVLVFYPCLASLALADDTKAAPLTTYDKALAAANAEFSATVDAAKADRQLQHGRIDGRFNDRVGTAAAGWRTRQQEANARAINDFRKAAGAAQREGNLARAQQLEQEQQAFIQTSLEQAQAFDLALAEVLAPAPPPAESDSVLIEARVSGKSALHITPSGLYWENLNHLRKPDAVALDGRPWTLQWSNTEENSIPDTSAHLDLPLDLAHATVELVYATSGPRGTGGIFPDAVLTTRLLDRKIVVTLSDDAPAVGYYGLRIRGLTSQSRTRLARATPEPGNIDNASPTTTELMQKLNNSRWVWRGGPTVVTFAASGEFLSTRWDRPGSWRPRSPCSVEATVPGGERWEIIFDSEMQHFLCITPTSDPRIGRRVVNSPDPATADNP